MQKQCGLLGCIPAGSTVSPSGRRPCSAASVACCRRPGTVCSSSAGGACGTCPGTASCTKSGKSISARGRARVSRAQCVELAGVSAKSVRGVGGRAWGADLPKRWSAALWGAAWRKRRRGSLRGPGAAAVQLACRVPWAHGRWPAWALSAAGPAPSSCSGSGCSPAPAAPAASAAPFTAFLPGSCCCFAWAAQVNAAQLPGSTS